MKSFVGEKAFLSNMYPCELFIDGISYSCSEAAFQAQKCANKEDRHKFANINGYEAKRLGRTVKLRSDWEAEKVNEMKRILVHKFTKREMAYKLMLTEGEELVETNDWHDTFWGVCNGRGSNNLGKLLMEIRSALFAKYQCDTVNKTVRKRA